MKNIHFALLILSLTLFSCKAKKMIDYDKIAMDLCNCMQDVVDLNKEIQQQVQDRNTEKLSGLYKQMDVVLKDAMNCSKKLEEKYGNFSDPEQKAKADNALKRKCPKVANIINQETDALPE